MTESIGTRCEYRREHLRWPARILCTFCILSSGATSPDYSDGYHDDDDEYYYDRYEDAREG